MSLYKRQNLLVWKCQIDPSLRNIHSHRRATHKFSYYTDMQRQTLDTSSQEWNPPIKNAKLLSWRTEWSNEHYSTITHREHAKGTVNLHERSAFIYSPSYCSKHIWHAPKTTKSILKIVHMTQTHNILSALKPQYYRKRPKPKPFFSENLSLKHLTSYFYKLNILVNV